MVSSSIPGDLRSDNDVHEKTYLRVPEAFGGSPSGSGIFMTTAGGGSRFFVGGGGFKDLPFGY
mgnify:CR=1 FL=1